MFFVHISQEEKKRWHNFDDASHRSFYVHFSWIKMNKRNVRSEPSRKSHKRPKKKTNKRARI